MPSLRLKIQYNKNTGIIMSPTELIDNYLFGVPLCSNDGRKISTQSLIQHIEAAQTSVENVLNIKLSKQVIEETRDFVKQEFLSWGYIRTMYPISYISDLEGWISGVCQTTYPRGWLSIKRMEDVAIYRNVYLIPNSGGRDGATMTNNSVVFNGVSPHLGFFGQTYIPNYWRATYVTGWNKIPSDLFDFVSKYAAINLLAVIGDVLYGIGITSVNLSLDGVSQSTPLSRSAQGGIFAGRIKLYQEEIQTSFPSLKSKYRGIPFEVL